MQAVPIIHRGPGMARHGLSPLKASHTHAYTHAKMFQHDYTSCRELLSRWATFYMHFMYFKQQSFISPCGLLAGFNGTKST